MSELAKLKLTFLLIGFLMLGYLAYIMFFKHIPSVGIAYVIDQWHMYVLSVLGLITATFMFYLMAYIGLTISLED